MKTAAAIIGKLLTLSFLMIYLSVSLSYIFFLPKHNYSNATTAVSLHQGQGNLSNGNNNSQILFHRLYKSTTETKRNVVFTVAAALTSISIIAAGMLFSGLTNMVNSQWRYSRIPNQYAFLNFCSLRI